MARTKNSGSFLAKPAAAKASRREVKRREAIENRVATNKLQKQIENQAKSGKTVGKIIVAGGGEAVTADMVTSYRTQSAIDRISSLLPSAKSLRSAAFVQSMGAKPGAGGAFGLLAQDYTSPGGRGGPPWLEGVALPVSLNDELHHFYEYVKLSDHEIEAREAVLRDMTEAICGKWPEAELRTFGSYPAGLSTFNGDLDLSIMLRHHRQAARRRALPPPGEDSPGRTPDAAEAVEEDAPEELAFEFDRMGDAQTTVDADDGADDAAPLVVDLTGDSDPEGAARKRARVEVPSDIEVHVAANSALSFGEAADTLAVPPHLFFRHPLRAAGPAEVPDEGDGSGGPAQRSLKAERVERLRVMCSHLRTMGWLDTIEFRSRARVPIINLRHKAGIECDVGLGIDAEDTTAHVHMMMNNCFAGEFKVVAFFLKMLLHVNELDKPFTGGIGSYKLYVMIAYVFARVKKYYDGKAKEDGGASLPADPDAAFLLMTFLKYFSNYKNLNRDTVLEVRNCTGPFCDGAPRAGPTADFDAAFNIHMCCDLFDLVRQRLDSSQAASEPESHLARLFLRRGRDPLSAAREKSRRDHSARGGGGGHALQPWGARSEGNREQVAAAILAHLQHRLDPSGAQRALTLQEVDEGSPALAARLRSYRSLEDATRHLDGKIAPHKYNADVGALSSYGRVIMDMDAAGSGDRKASNSAMQALLAKQKTLKRRWVEAIDTKVPRKASDAQQARVIEARKTALIEMKKNARLITKQQKVHRKKKNKEAREKREEASHNTNKRSSSDPEQHNNSVLDEALRKTEKAKKTRRKKK